MAAVHHMVVIKFKPGVQESQIDELFGELAKLQQLIRGIQYYSAGPYSSPEGLHGGFTHGFLMIFESAAARDAYLPHPEHERVKDLILPHVENVVVFDFESEGTT